MNYSYRIIRQLVFAAGFVLVTGSAVAQQNWFIFIQSEGRQPFYARIDEKIYSSSAIGYLTIAELKDSTYKIVIGFPKNQYREETFSIPVARKDHGYQLRRSGGQEWTLYNWQNQHTLRPVKASDGGELTGERKKDDGFADLMAAVVNDSSVLYTSVIKKPVVTETAVTKPAEDSAAKKEDVVKVDSGKKQPADSAIVIRTNESVMATPDTLAEEKKDTAKTDIARRTGDTAKSTVVTKPVEEKDSAVAKAEEKKPAITKLREQTRNGEKRLVFLDASSIKPDTVTVIIPAEKTPAPPKKEENVVASAEKDTTKVIVENDKPKAVMNVPVRDIADTPANDNKKADSALASKTIASPVTKQPLNIINSDCRSFATVQDVDKLRVKMLAQKEAGDRIFTAFKVFKTKCFTTSQVHALSELFTTDENRYKFFETAWPYVSDTAQFRNLVDVFTEEFFKTRFRTLVRIQ